MTKLKPIKSAKEYKEACKKLAKLEKLIAKETSEKAKVRLEYEELDELITDYESNEL